MKKIQHILFDCDGTLVDSETPAMGVAIDVLADRVEQLRPDAKLDRKALVQEFAGGHFSQMIKAMEDRYDVELDHTGLSTLKTQRTLDILKTVAPTTGMMKALENLRTADRPMAVVTSSEFDRVNLCLEVTGIHDYFPAQRKFSAVDTLAVATPKPDPAIYLHALAALDIKAEDAVAIEDSVSGTKSARAAGIAVVGFIGASHIPQDRKKAVAETLMQHGATVVISDMHDLEAALDYVEDHSRNSFKHDVYRKTAADRPAASAPAPQL